FPARRLDDERDGGRTPPAKEKSSDRHALRVLPLRIDGRALRGEHREPRVGVCSEAPAARRPLLALPIDEAGRRALGHSLHQPAPSGVMATLVKITFACSMRMAFGLVASEVPGATPKKPYSGLIA